MKINSDDKALIFSAIKEDFGELQKGEKFSLFFEKNKLCEKGYSYHNGVFKYCIKSENFGDFVVKFCLGKFDHCEREYTNYLAAVERQLDIFFPYTDYLGSFNNINFFIQERADCDKEVISSLWYNSLREDYENEEDEDEYMIAEKIWDMMYYLEDERRARYCFGSEEKLFDFLDKYEINDLHAGNFGYIGERLVIIDFSGYIEREF